MRQGIVTKYLGPTDHKGGRVKAIAQAGSVTLPWDHALDTNENHDAVAVALANKFGWLSKGEKLLGGGLPSGEGNLYVIIGDTERDLIRKGY